MLKLIFWFILFAAAITGLTWLAAHPGNMSVDWLGYHVDSMPVALAIGVVLFAVFAIWLIVRVLRMMLASPGAAADFFRLRRRKKGLDELSSGLTALLAGDAASARASAGKAARLVPGEPVARLLEARAAQEMGDDKTARVLLTGMLKDEKTEAAALHGLYQQARKEGDLAAARGWAERAWKKYPALPWAAKAMLAFKAAEGNWPAVITMLESQRKSGLVSKEEAQRKKAAALTAMARETEEKDPARAIDMATQAHRFDPALIPAAVIAGGMLAARGQMRKAAKILEKTWKLSPHPDIAEVYAHLRAGDSPADRLKRVKSLLRINSGGEEGAVALARAAIDARDWDAARGALRTWLNDNPSSRIYQLMAEIEQEQYGDRGRAREWLARAVRAKRDPAWTADGVVSPEWRAFSPVSGEIGAFEWKTPVSGSERLTELEPVPAELLEAPALPVEEEDLPTATPEPAGEAEPEPPVRENEPAASGEEAHEEKSRPPAKPAGEMKPEAAEEEKPATGTDEERPAPPPPGKAPAAPPVIELRAHKTKPEKPAAAPETESGKPKEPEKSSKPDIQPEPQKAEILKAPIPDDPGPKPQPPKPKKKGWFG